MMGVVKISDRLWSVAESRAKKSANGVGIARTKNHSVAYLIDPYGLGMDTIESVRFIEQPMLKNR